MLERLIGEDIRIEWRPSPGAWPVRIDPSQVDQVVANLCVNARDAIRGSGRIAIETANVHVTAQQAAMQGGWMAGDYVVLTVTDDGVGMDKATLAMVFEPFFTTKEVGKGTGLGLATVYGIVKQNGGFISVTSQPGGGTTFCVYLPRHGESPAGLPPSSVPELVRGEVGPAPSGVTVLLVEDEPTLLAITGRMLRAIGYVVLTASTPDDALRLSEARREPIDVLLSDVVMPGMNGQQLAEALARTRPGLKCLFMSGYTADVIATHGVLDAGVHFLQKPFTRHELAARVRAVLGV